MYVPLECSTHGTSQRVQIVLHTKQMVRMASPRLAVGGSILVLMAPVTAHNAGQAVLAVPLDAGSAPGRVDADSGAGLPAAGAGRHQGVHIWGGCSRLPLLFFPVAKLTCLVS